MEVMCVKQDDLVSWQDFITVFTVSEPKQRLFLRLFSTSLEVVLTEKVDSRVMASVLFMDFTVVKQSVTLKNWLQLV